MCSEAFQWEFAAPSASDGRPFAVGDRMGQRARRASARRERDLAQVHDPSLEESAVAYLAAGVQTTAGGSTQGWIWWRDFMRSLGEGDVGFPILFGGGFLSDTYPDVFRCILHVSCMYFDVSYQDTSRYIKIHQDTFVSVTLA